MKRKVSQKTILVVSTYYFLNKGVKDGRIDDISTHLKISKKTIYAYFNTKKILVEATLDYLFKKIEDQVRAIINLDIRNNEKWYLVIDYIGNQYMEISHAFFGDMLQLSNLRQKFDMYNDQMEDLILSNLVHKNLRKQRSLILKSFYIILINGIEKYSVNNLNEKRSFFINEIGLLYGKYMIEE